MAELTKVNAGRPCGCPWAAGSLSPTAPAILVSAFVNGIEGRFIVDTGATAVTLTHEFARKTGIDLSAKRRAQVVTANGIVTMTPSLAQEIRVDTAAAKNIYVMVQPAAVSSLGPRIDGLLGLSFLANFDLTLSRGRLQLATR